MVLTTLSGAVRGSDSPLNDLLELLKGSVEFDFLFTDDVANTHHDFFPLNQAQNARDAFDLSYDVFTQAPYNFLTPFVTTLPDFNVTINDSTNVGGAGTGGISLDAPNLVSQTECFIRGTSLHELFHTIQYSYNNSKPSVQRWARESTARAMEDKSFTDLDNSIVCNFVPGEVNGYMGNPDQDLFASDNPYKSALFWMYAMEQLGNTAGEPQRGVDFIRRFWERVEDTANNSTDDAIEELRQTVSEFAAGKNTEQNFDDFFRDFGIANYTHNLDATALPNPNRYRYVDETAAGGGVTFNAVSRDMVAVPSSGSSSVTRYGNHYLEADISSNADCIVVGFHGESDETVGWALLGIKSGGRAVTLSKAKGQSFFGALLQPTSDPFVKLAVVVTGLDDSTNFDYDFAIGNVKVQIERPTLTRQALVGPHDAPGSFIARLRVNGIEELTPAGAASIKGLEPSTFEVTVGGDDATVVTGAYVGGDYWLVVQAPVKPADGLFDLQIVSCGVSATSRQSILYGDYIMNQVIVLDKSGSMNAPTGNTKISAARVAGSLFVDAARTGDRLGVVTFNGTNNECNDDSQLLRDLDTVNDANRTAARNAIGGVLTSGWTSIGDGIERAEGRLDVKATTPLDFRYIILLSDGMENEGRFWNSVNTCAGGGSEAAVRPGVLASGTVVHSIAFGPETNQELMQEIASSTTGDYYYVDVSEGLGGSVDQPDGSGAATGISPSLLRLPNRISDVYVSVADRIRGRQRLFSAVGTTVAGKELEKEFPLRENEVADAVFFFNWDDPGAGLAVVLLDGAGNQVTTATHPVEISQNLTHKVYRFLKPISPGQKQWTALITGQKATQVLCGLSGRPISGVRLDLVIGQYLGAGQSPPAPSFLVGQPIQLVGILTDRKGRIRGANVSGEVERPNGQIDEIALVDDGAHDDGAANDGVYGVLYTRTDLGSRGGVPDDQSGKDPGQRGSYVVSLVGTGESNEGEAFTRFANGGFQVVLDTELNPDRDQDGLPDRWEIAHGFDPLKPNGKGDPDGDGLPNDEEYRRGTDPNDPDTDDGGESDGSEVKRGANPLNPRDDSPCRLTSYSLVTRVSDSDREGVRPVPQANVLMWSIPLERCKPLVHVFCAIRAPEKFERVATIRPGDRDYGAFIHKGLTVGLPYYYYLVVEGQDGAISAPSDVLLGIPLDDPLPPEGWVHINCGSPTTDSLDVKVSLDLSSEAVEFILSASTDFSLARWTELSKANVPFGLAKAGPVPGPRFVYCKYRNKSGAESYTYSASIFFDPRGNFDRDRLSNEMDPDDDNDGVSDVDEIQRYCSKPFDADSDGDGLPDGEEVRRGTNPTSSDTDGDGLDDREDPDPLVRTSLQRGGDCNQDGQLNMADGICLLGHLFLGTPNKLPCGGGAVTDQANINLLDLNGSRAVDISDAGYLFGYLFLGSRPPIQGLECRPINGCQNVCKP